MVEGTLDPTFTPTLRLEAPNRLLLTVPGGTEGLLTPDGSSGTNPDVGLFLLGYLAPGGHTSISRIFKTGMTSLLSHSAQASWVSDFNAARPSDPYLLSPFIYGVPTVPAALPAAGIQTYTVSIYSTGAHSNLTVDFSARTVTGSVMHGSPTGPLTLSLQGVSFTGDGSQFSGDLVTSGNTFQGTFEGRFTGPTGDELIGRYTVPGAGGVGVELLAGYRE